MAKKLNPIYNNNDFSRRWTDEIYNKIPMKLMDILSQGIKNSSVAKDIGIREDADYLDVVKLLDKLGDSYKFIKSFEDHGGFESFDFDAYNEGTLDTEFSDAYTNLAASIGDLISSNLLDRSDLPPAYSDIYTKFIDSFGLADDTYNDFNVISGNGFSDKNAYKGMSGFGKFDSHHRNYGVRNVEDLGPLSVPPLFTESKNPKSMFTCIPAGSPYFEELAGIAAEAGTGFEPDVRTQKGGKYKHPVSDYPISGTWYEHVEQAIDEGKRFAQACLDKHPEWSIVRNDPTWCNINIGDICDENGIPILSVNVGVGVAMDMNLWEKNLEEAWLRSCENRRLDDRIYEAMKPPVREFRPEVELLGGGSVVDQPSAPVVARPSGPIEDISMPSHGSVVGRKSFASAPSSGSLAGGGSIAAGGGISGGGGSYSSGSGRIVNTNAIDGIVVSHRNDIKKSYKDDFTTKAHRDSLLEKYSADVASAEDLVSSAESKSRNSVSMGY